MIIQMARLCAIASLVVCLYSPVIASDVCGEVPLYSSETVTPAIMVMLDLSGSMNNSMEGGAYGDTRLEVAENVLKELFEDQAVSWGLSTWSWRWYSQHSNTCDYSEFYRNNICSKYTKIDVGIKAYSDDHKGKLDTALTAASAGGSTPLGPAMQAGADYFNKRRPDVAYVTNYEDLSCQAKIVIMITDGYANRGSYQDGTNDLLNAGVSVVAVGFAAPDNAVSQLKWVANRANVVGAEDDTDKVYALHKTVDGVPVPYIASSPAEFLTAMKEITQVAKNQNFYGSAPAASTSIGDEDFLISARFIPRNNDDENWTGDLIKTYYNSAGELDEDSTNNWTVSTKNTLYNTNNWLYNDGTGSGRSVSVFTDAVCSDDNYNCKFLGDIINSTPVIVGAPAYFYDYLNYSKFKKDNKDRKKIVYVNSNDGALHAFNLSSGVEEWRLFPNTVVAGGGNVNADLCGSSEDPWCHKYINDGSPTVYDVYDEAETKWRTVLYSGLGKGGSAFLAVDITDPDSSKISVLWEKKRNFIAKLDADGVFESLVTIDTGYATSLPEVARTRNKRWHLYTGSGGGLAGANQKAYLIGRDAISGDPLWKNGVSAVLLSGLSENVASSPLTVDAGIKETQGTEANGNIERVYIGDSYNTMFRVRNIGTDKTPRVQKLLTQKSNTTTPITAKAGYAYRVTDDGDWVQVVFGTGRYSTESDRSETYQQSFYSLYDQGKDSYSQSDSKIHVMTTSFKTATGVAKTLSSYSVDDVGDTMYRTVSGSDSTKDSWRLALAADSTNPSERILSQPVIVGGIVFFTTFIPNTDKCSGGGDSFLFALNYKDGSVRSKTVLDINNDGKFNDSDFVDGQAVAGLFVGKGVASKVVVHNGKVALNTTGGGQFSMNVDLPDTNIKMKSWKQIYNN